MVRLGRPPGERPSADFADGTGQTGIRLAFGFADSLAAELIGRPLADLHTDVGAMLAAAEALAPLAERLGVDRPRPRLAGLGYAHVSTLGATVTISPDAAEPYVTHPLRDPDDIDRLGEPDDYLAAGLVPGRLALLEELLARRPDAARSIGHELQGPATTAGLLLGPAFFTLPHDDPARARRLLEFCTNSSIRYCRVIGQRLGRAVGPGPVGFPDDFAGLFSPAAFAEFIVPCWRRIYEELGATRRSLHSELLREDHLPHLADLGIDCFDPSVDQYLPADVLRRACPVPYGLRIWPAWMRDKSAEELVALYRRFAADRPEFIMFHMARPDEEPKIAALLAAHREGAGCAGPRG